MCVGSRFVRLVQALSSFPPSAGLVPCPSTLRFSFPLPFQGLPAPGQVCRVGVLSFFFCVPLFASWLSNCSSHFQGHLTFTSPSSSSSPHFPSHHPAKGRVCVCVTHLYRCKTSISCCIYIYAGEWSRPAELHLTKLSAVSCRYHWRRPVTYLLGCDHLFFRVCFLSHF